VLLVLKVCAKALEPEEEEEAEHRPAGASEQVKVQGQGQAEGKEQPTQPQQGQQQPSGAPSTTTTTTGGEGKEAELSGGEKQRERAGQMTQPKEQQRRYLIHEIPSKCTLHSLLTFVPPFILCSSLPSSSLCGLAGRIERSVRLPADAAEVNLTQPTTTTHSTTTPHPHSRCHALSLCWLDDV
jgi:hypothetical protein